MIGGNLLHIPLGKSIQTQKYINNNGVIYLSSIGGACTDSFTMGGPTGLNPMDLCGTLTGMHGKYSLFFCKCS